MVVAFYTIWITCLILSFFSVIFVSCRIKPGLKATVYCTAIRNGGEAAWNFAYNQFKVANVAAERVRLLDALACTQEPWLINR